MQPPGGLPIYAESLVGYAQWYLQRGVDAVEVETRIAADERFAGIPDDVVLAAIAVAQQNVHAGELLRTGQAATTIGYAFGGELPATQRVGVRVIIELVGPTGVPITASVVLDVSVYATAGQILETVEQWVNNGNLAPRGRQSGQGTFQSAYIGDLYGTGLQNAAIYLP